MKIEYKEVNSIETENINQISDWYFNEWKIPKEKTIKSLTDISNKNVIFQTLMINDETPIGTGGLYNKVGIQNRIKKYESCSPWIALMFTKPEIRGKGLGGKLLDKIELEAKKKDLKRFIYLLILLNLYI